MTLRRARHATALLFAAVLVAGSTACDSESGSESSGSESQATSPDQTAPSSDNEESADRNPGRGDSLGVPIPGGTDNRTFRFTYETTIQPGNASGSVDIFLPIATDTEHQTIRSRKIDTDLEGEVRTEQTYGNKFWYASLDAAPEEPKTITVTYVVERKVFQRQNLGERARGSLSKEIKDEHSLYLKANERVPTSGDLIEKVAKDAGLEDLEEPYEISRAIYDHVVETMDYKKTGSGWGNGDTYWACKKGYGNCTDFHALFTSLARYKEIPARFEIGFPIPTDRKRGKIGGYHCWLKFYLPGVGWTPIDASEAKKHPEYRDLYFGTHPANRIHFTSGRDLSLGDEHDTGPLNYFVYPHVEVGDEPYDNVETSFSYEELDDA